MNNKVKDSLFTPDESAAHIVDTLVDWPLFSPDLLQKALEAVAWELAAQSGMGRVILNVKAV